MGAIDKESTDFGVVVFIRSYDLNPKQCLVEICQEFQLQSFDLIWKNDDLGSPKWVVFEKKSDGLLNELYRFQTEQLASNYCQIHSSDGKNLIYQYCV